MEKSVGTIKLWRMRRMKGGVSARNRIQEDEMRKKMLEENGRRV